jgi:hypothetical protein
VRLVYDPRRLSGVTIVSPGVPGVLQMVSESTLTVSRAHTGQLRRILWRTGQGRGICTHDAWVLWEGHGMVYMLLTRRMIRVYQY